MQWSVFSFSHEGCVMDSFDPLWMCSCSSRFVFVPGPQDPGPGAVLPRYFTFHWLLYVSFDQTLKLFTSLNEDDCVYDHRPPLAEHITEDFTQRVPFSVFTTNPCRSLDGLFICMYVCVFAWSDLSFFHPHRQDSVLQSRDCSDSRRSRQQDVQELCTSPQHNPGHSKPCELDVCFPIFLSGLLSWTLKFIPSKHLRPLVKI